MRVGCWLAVLVGWLAGSSPAVAQLQNFDRVAPKVGAEFPRLELLDGDGETVDFRKLIKGQPAVVVFGCLT